MVSLRRKIFFYIFVLLFFILSFYAITYAQGYKIKLTFPPNLSMVQRTGMILIKSDPAEALVYLNNQAQKSFFKEYLFDDPGYYKTPAKIKHLLPGEYEITLKKDGYHPWQERIRVYSGKITTLSDIHLFKEELPLKISEYNFRKENLSPDKKYLVNPRKRIIFDLENQKEIEFDLKKEVLKKENNSIKWSPRSNCFFWNQELIYPGNPGKNKDLSTYFSEKTEKTEWGEKGEKIYYQGENHFKSLNLDNLKSQKIAEEKYSDFLIKDDYLFILKNEQNNRLKVKNLNSEKAYQSVRLPRSSGYEIKNFKNGLIHIYDQEYKILYLIQFTPPLLNLKETVNNIKYYNWLNEKKMIYGNNFEIWSLDLKKRQKKLHGRISEKIENLITHPESNNIIYYTNKNIKIIDLIKENKINIIELTEMNQISELLKGPGKNDIYFNGEIGHQSGLYKLNIK